MASYYKAPTTNYWSNTLDGAINDSVQTITLTDATGLQAPGVVVINRVDSSGTATPGSREIVSYTGVSGNDLTGCTRGAESSTARSHIDGSVVEAVLTVTQWNDLRDGVATALTTDGTGLHLTGTASIANLHIGTSLNMPSAASIAYIVDEDDMASDSNIALVTQQSVKAYVDRFDSTKASAYLSSTANVTASTPLTVVFDTEFYDTGSNYDHTTGLYTAPSTGLYLVTGQLNYSVTADQDRIYVQVAKNGTTVWSFGVAAASNLNHSLTTTALVLASATDTISIVANNVTNNDTITGGSTNCLFSIIRIA